MILQSAITCKNSGLADDKPYCPGYDLSISKYRSLLSDRNSSPVAPCRNYRDFRASRDVQYQGDSLYDQHCVGVGICSPSERVPANKHNYLSPV